VKGNSISNGSRSGRNCTNSGEEDSDGDDSNENSSSSDEDVESRAGRDSSPPTAKAKITSAYRGVYFNRNKGLWEALLCLPHKNIYAGQSRNESDAARAYDTKASTYFTRPVLNFDPVSGRRNKDCKLGKHR
jgi:hypothetical protein